MDHQNTGSYTDCPPALPDVAVGFPGLQLQPHTDSPSMSNSDGSESIGVDPPIVSLPEFAGSACSLNSLDDLAATPPVNTELVTSLPVAQAQNAALSADELPNLDAMDIKMEPQLNTLSDATAAAAMDTDAAKQQPSSPTLACAMMSSASAAMPATIGISYPGLMSAAPGVSLPIACTAAVSTVQSEGVSMAADRVLNPWAAMLPGPVGTQLQTSQPQLVFLQPTNTQQHQLLPMQRQTRQQTLNSTCSAFAAAAATTRTGDITTRTAIASGSTTAGGKGMQRSQSVDAGSGCKMQVSHSTVEKQRRDRLNSLIDELSDIVPPADPKYGSDANSVRRPKHVVLADTINLLKAMQAKLQIEEAEICTLKQQAAAVVAIAAAQQQQHQASPAGDGTTTGSDDAPVLPVAPEGCASTGVLVEQGVNCLFVKVNCKDRKGLLSDVVSALKTFPVVISTAAITTTKDGTVHDVFEVGLPLLTPSCKALLKQTVNCSRSQHHMHALSAGYVAFQLGSKCCAGGCSCV